MSASDQRVQYADISHAQMSHAPVSMTGGEGLSIALPCDNVLG